MVDVREEKRLKLGYEWLKKSGGGERDIRKYYMKVSGEGGGEKVNTDRLLYW